MSFAPAPNPGNPYAAAQAVADGAEPAFAHAISAALSATESVEDVELVTSPARNGQKPDQSAVQSAQHAPVSQLSAPAEFAGVTVSPPEARVSGDAVNGWRIEAGTLELAVAKAHTLGVVELHSARRLTRGIRPWRRESFEVQARLVGQPDSATGQEGAREDPAAAAASPASVGDFIASRVRDGEHGAVSLEDRLRQIVATSPSIEETSVGRPSAVAAGEAADTVAAEHGSEVVRETLEVDIDADASGNELVPRPVLPPVSPDLNGIHVPTALIRMGLTAQLVADTLSLEPESNQDWVEALTVVADDALSRAGHLDSVMGGPVVHGAGARGAAAIINAAHAGDAVGLFTWRGATGVPTANALACAIVSVLLLV